jgi:hypothetical protein
MLMPNEIQSISDWYTYRYQVKRLTDKLDWDARRDSNRMLGVAEQRMNMITAYIVSFRRPMRLNDIEKLDAMWAEFREGLVELNQQLLIARLYLI